jgi:hypothetical protein
VSSFIRARSVESSSAILKEIVVSDNILGRVGVNLILSNGCQVFHSWSSTRARLE